MHICIGKLTITGSDNGLLPGYHQAIIWTSAGILLIGPLGTNFSEILIRIQTFSFKNKSDGKRRNTLGCLDQYMCNVLRLWNSWDLETV